MASNVKPHQRAFALTIAIIFLVTTLATSVLVVMAILDENKQNDAISQTDPAATNNSALTQDCAISSVAGAAGTAPEIFKPSGDVTALETTDIEPGTGDVIKAGDCIIAKYYGSLATTGAVFDENFTKETALQVKIGTGSVIPGWDEGIVGMKVGGTRRLVIPADKAYGDQGSETIPANSDLVFVVKITEIKK